MKFTHFSAAIGILLAVLLCSGCMNASPQGPSQTTAPTPVVTTLPPTNATIVPTPAVTAYPGALALGQYATFGTEGRQAKATIYKCEIRPNYNWTAPTFNSPGSQSGCIQTKRGPAGLYYPEAKNRKYLPVCLCQPGQHRHFRNLCSLGIAVCRIRQWNGL